MDLYCVKCKAKTSTDSLTTIVTKGIRLALSGKCTRCGIKKIQFTKKGGDIAANLGKLPSTPWAKYPGEKHLPGYNYCGPVTRLDIRLDQPKPGEYPINAIDAACHAHDVAYKSKNFQDRHIAE